MEKLCMELGSQANARHVHVTKSIKQRHYKLNFTQKIVPHSNNVSWSREKVLTEEWRLNNLLCLDPFVSEIPLKKLLQIHFFLRLFLRFTFVCRCLRSLNEKVKLFNTKNFLTFSLRRSSCVSFRGLLACLLACCSFACLLRKRNVSH